MNFESAWSLVGDDEDYATNYRAFKAFNQDLADQYVELLMMDSFCLNADRHTNNYGILRDIQSGQVLKMAPNFDNNIALVSNGYDKRPRQPDLFGQLLAELEADEQAVSSYAQRHLLPRVTPDLIAKCCVQTGEAIDIAYIQQFVMAGYEQTPIPTLLAPRHLQRRSLQSICVQAKEAAAKANIEKADAPSVEQELN